MAMPKLKKVTKPVKSKPVALVKFSIGPDEYFGEGATIHEALMQIKPKRFSGMCKVEATVGGRVSRVPIKLVPINMRRMFAKPIELALFAKRLQILL